MPGGAGHPAVPGLPQLCVPITPYLASIGAYDSSLQRSAKAVRKSPLDVPTMLTARRLIVFWRKLAAFEHFRYRQYAFSVTPLTFYQVIYLLRNTKMKYSSGAASSSAEGQTLSKEPLGGPGFVCLIDGRSLGQGLGYPIP